ncbi:TolC family protein [Veillonella criceti]|uniref:Outer membrane protein tolC n=1 Tax=Veillonella criceti TaxID=103891 RepID=A0A380NLE3_9FIRM|nr:TolC family protein [Veillonella criceti]SUP42513.1 Outer membrane protein tolC precursor [Veillonella criceti]
MANKKALSLAIVLALTATSVWAADTTTDSKLTKYQQAALVTTQQTVANKIATDEVIGDKVSLTLPHTVELALINNRDVRQAGWAYEAAKAKVSVAAAAKNPTIGYGYSGSRTTADSSHVTAAGHGISIEVPIYTGGKVESAIDAARYSREGFNAALEVQRQTTKLDAAKGYFGLIQARNKVDVANQTIKDYDSQLTNVNQQYNVGLVAKSDVLAAQTAVANAQTELVTAQNSANLAEAKLNNLIALPVNTSVETADAMLGYTPYNVSLEEAQAYAMLHRAELVQSTMAVKAAEEQIKSAKAGYMPKLSAKASQDWKGSDWDGTDNNSWTISANVAWSLWDGGATSEGIKVAEADLEQAKEANYQAVDSVNLSVREAYLNMKAAEQTIQSTRVAVEQGQENFRIASLRYRAGVGTNVDVLDAETKLTTARNNYVDALFNYNIAVASLETAMGVPLDTPIGGAAPLVNEANASQTLATLVATATK